MSIKKIDQRIKKLQQEMNPEEDEIYALQWDDNQGPWAYLHSSNNR